MWSAKTTSNEAPPASAADPAQTDTSSKAEAAAPSSSSDAFNKALSSNKAWAASFREKESSLLSALSKGQKPRILWIGCSDSRVPETTLLGLQPGDVFTHRNIANIVSPTDASSAAVIQYAVTALGVEHVVLCGHTSCGGAQAALGNKPLGGVLDLWLLPLRAVRGRIAGELAALDDTRRWRRLVEENVRAGVSVLKENAHVIRAAHERGLKVHGVVYDIATGELEVVEVAEEQAAEKARAECFGME